jgi:LPXTG-motif cell wall-anchored protein
LLSSLTEGKHQLNLASGAETLDFVLTVGAEGSESAEVEASATTSTKTLPAAGSTTNSLLFLAFAMLSVGLGLIIRAKQS